MASPLAGVRVVEIGSIGPGPFAGMLLADLGADVVRVDRGPQATAAGVPLSPAVDFMGRGRRSLVLDLKAEADRALALALVERADALIEGFRPGVLEKLGLGPEACLARNSRLVFGRMTGWGQTGPLAPTAGHDINYLALSGALHAMGDADRPPSPPLNLVADFGGGALFLALGVVSALWSARQTGVGQVVDAAMVDGCAALTTLFHSLRGAGLWQDARGVNLLDGSAHFYTCYACADGEFVAVGAIEPQFYAQLLAGLGVENPEQWPQFPSTVWPPLKREMADIFRTKTRTEWAETFAGTDACVTPVLSMSEAAEHPHLVARGTFVTVDGARQPGPAPRFGATPAEIRRGPAVAGQDRQAILQDWGIEAP